MQEIEFITRLLASTAAMVRTARAQRSPDVADAKADPADLLTETDLAAQKHIRGAIEAAYPRDAFLGEEGDGTVTPEQRAGRCWVCDPIDGTHNFVRSLFGTYGVSLALVEGGSPIAGGIALPERGEVLLAARGRGAHRDGKPLRVSRERELAASKVEIDFQRPPMRPRILNATAKAMLEIGQLRSHGSAVVGLTSVATGDADAFLHTHLQPWDFAAAALLVTEAGGRVTRFNGSPVDFYAPTCDIVASNSVIHDAILRIVTPPPPL